jgi:hypothetical protein
MFVYGAVGLLSAWALKFVNKGDRSKSFPLLELPIELVEEIVAKLCYADRCRLACVCSSLRELADNESFWESLFKQLLPGLATIIEASKSRWWRHSSWKKRFRNLTSGSRFKCQVFSRCTNQQCVTKYQPPLHCGCILYVLCLFYIICSHK